MAASFSVNDPFLFYLAGAILLVVAIQSVVFLRRSWKRAKSLGLSSSTLWGVVKTSALFTIVPAASILVGVIALSRKLGVPLPWLRLSVIGAITYETPAAEAAARAMGASLSDTGVALTASQYGAIAWVMTLGIMGSLLFVPILSKKLLSGVKVMEGKDARWRDIFMASLFMGMLSAFLGMIFGGVSKGAPGWIPVCVMVVSALIMALMGVLIRVKKWDWLKDYALTISMVGAMAAAIPLTMLLGGN